MLPNIYKGDYRLLAIAPITLMVIALVFIPSINMGVDFQGGTLVTLSLTEKVDGEALQAQLLDEGLDAKVRVFETSIGYRAEIEVPQSQNLVRAEELKGEFNAMLPEVSSLEVAAYQNSTYEAEYQQKRAELEAIAEELYGLAGMKAPKTESVIDIQNGFSDAYSRVYTSYQESISGPINKHVSYESISVQTVSPVLSTKFIEKVINVVIMSAILSVILVFAFFRSIPPSIAVLTGAFCDIVIALGAMGIFGIPLTLPSFAALMMLVGYSLDTDILLTTRIMKKKGDPRENAHDAMKTGLTMSGTGMIAFGALFVLSMMTHIPTYYEISAVALAGLVGDMFATWGINAVMILHYKLKSGGA
jgi:preprotein translocase subunit SecF